MQILATMSLVFLALAGVSLVMLCIQMWTVAAHVRQPPARPGILPGVSILKPLCGVDDDLEGNLLRFATFDYPEYELLLGVRSTADAAFPVACEAARRWPDRVRVVVQRGEPGLNPKVNQLITLSGAARYAVLLVSDSNVRVGAEYLDETVAGLMDPRVGIVTHPVIGVDEDYVGSCMDNMHLTSFVGTGMIAAKRLFGMNVVVGKSMALWRRDVAALGGFESMKDVLGEDYVIGQRVTSELGKTVVMARTPVMNVSRTRTVGEFFGRYKRWSVMHRQAVGIFGYLFEFTLNPIALAVIGTALRPSLMSFGALASVCLLKVAFEAMAGWQLRPTRFSFGSLLWTPAKDLILAAAWLYGLLQNEVNWRGNVLRVLPGTKLSPKAPRKRRRFLVLPMRLIRRRRAAA